MDMSSHPVQPCIQPQAQMLYSLWLAKRELIKEGGVGLGGQRGTGKGPVCFIRRHCWVVKQRIRIMGLCQFVKLSKTDHQALATSHSDCPGCLIYYETISVYK